MKGEIRAGDMIRSWMNRHPRVVRMVFREPHFPHSYFDVGLRHGSIVGLLCAVFILVASTTLPAQTTTRNAFVSASVDDGSGKIVFYGGAPISANIISNTFGNSHSYLSVKVNNMVYSNNNGAVSLPPDVLLNNGVTTVFTGPNRADTVRVVWPESGFDIVQDIYPVAFDLSGQIVYKISIVNHGGTQLNVQAQYLLDVDVRGNDQSKILTRWNYTPNWTQYPTNTGVFPSFFMGFQYEPTDPRVATGLISTGYLNDSLAPEPMHLMQPTVFDVVDWQAASGVSNYAWGLPPNPPWATSYGDNALLLQWQATTMNGSQDTVLEIARGSYGTGEYTICLGNFTAISFYPHHITYDLSLQKYTPNPFHVTSFLFDLSTLDAKKTVDTQTVSGPLRIKWPLPVNGGGRIQFQGVGDSSSVTTGGVIPSLDVATADWIDSTVDITNCSGDSAASISFTVGSSVVQPFFGGCELPITIDCSVTDIVPPKISVTGGAEFDSSLSITDSAILDRGLQQVSWSVTPASATANFPVTVTWASGQSATVSPTSLSCLKTPVAVSIHQRDSTISGCVDLTVTDCNGNHSLREICFPARFPAAFKDTHAPLIWLLARGHWPFGKDSSGGCTNQWDSLVAIDTQLYDRGVVLLDTVSGAGFNMTLHSKTPPGQQQTRAIGFTVLVQDSLSAGRIVVLASDTSGNTSYDTIRYCTLPDTLPPIMNVQHSQSYPGWHVRVSDTRPWDRGVGCVYFLGVVNAAFILPPGLDSSRQGDTLIICSAKCDSTLAFDVHIIDTFADVAFTARARDCAGHWGVTFPEGSSGLFDNLCPGITWRVPPLDTASDATVDSAQATISDFHYTAGGSEINYDLGIDSVWFTNVHNVDLYLPIAVGDRAAGLYSPPVSIHFSGVPNTHPEFPKLMAFTLKVHDKNLQDSLPACATVNAVDGGRNTLCSGDTVTWCQGLALDVNAPQAVATSCTDASGQSLIAGTFSLHLSDNRLRDKGLRRAWLDTTTNINFNPFDVTYPVGTATDTRTLSLATTGKSGKATVHVYDLVGTQGVPGHETTFPIWLYAQNLRMASSQILTASGTFDVPVYLIPTDSIPLSQKQLSKYQFTIDLQQIGGSPTVPVAFVNPVTAGTLSATATATPGAGTSYTISGVVSPAGSALTNMTTAQMNATPMVILRFNATVGGEPAMYRIGVEGQKGAEVVYNDGLDSMNNGPNASVTVCPPYGSLEGGTIIIKGACSPIVSSDTHPSIISMEPATPNPAGTSTSLRYTIPTESVVQISLYNVLGVRVRTLVAESEPQGEYTLNIPLGDLTGGTYFVRLESAGKTITRSVILSR